MQMALGSAGEEATEMPALHREVEVSLSVVTCHAGSKTLRDAVTSWIGELPMGFDGPEVQYAGFINHDVRSVFVMNGLEGMIPACQRAVEWSKFDDILAYFHDDLIIHESDWAQRVVKEFEDPKVGLVGFGGSQTWGDPRIYKKPYEIMQLSRGEFLSNMTDAETHGTRYQGPPVDVAVLDGIALIFRREFLQRAGGWPVGKIVFHTYDFWACGMAHRLGYKIRLVPVSVTHIGGQTSVSQKMDDGMNHAEGHKWIYEEFVDVLTGGVRV